MGERLTRAYAEDAGLPGLTASSAGTHAAVGRGMEPSAARVLEGLGGDPIGFRARQLRGSMAEEADAVLVMEASHRDAVLRESPRALSRTFLLGEAAFLLPGVSSPAPVGVPADLLATMHGRRGRPGLVGLDVDDPIGRPPEVHQRVGDTIAAALIPVLEALERHLRAGDAPADRRRVAASTPGHPL